MKLRPLLILIFFVISLDSFSWTEDIIDSAGCPSCGGKVQNGQTSLDALDVTFEAIFNLSDCHRTFVDITNDRYREECFYLFTTNAYEAMKSLIEGMPELLKSSISEASRLQLSLNPFLTFYQWYTGETYFESTSEVVSENLKPFKELIKGHENEISYYLVNNDYRKKINSIAYQIILSEIYNSVDGVAKATCDEMVNVICPVLGELAPETFLEAIITAMAITTSGAAAPGLVAIKTEKVGAKLVVKANDGVVWLSGPASDAVKKTTKTTKAKKLSKTSPSKMHKPSISNPGVLGKEQIARLFGNVDEALAKLINPSDLEIILKKKPSINLPQSHRDKLKEVMKICDKKISKGRVTFDANANKGFSNPFKKTCQKIMPKSGGKYKEIDFACIWGSIRADSCNDLRGHLEQFQFGGNTFSNTQNNGKWAFPNRNKNNGNTSIKSMYVEMDIDINVTTDKRGKKRIVYDKETGDAWYTDDHYQTSTYAGCLGLKNKTCTPLSKLIEICSDKNSFSCSVP